MQSSPADATVADGLDRGAAALVEVALLVSRFIRAEMWRHRPSSLTVAQFHTLTFVNAYPDAAPSEVADYLMMSRAAITRLVDELEARRLLARKSATADRRRVMLSVTAAGRRRLDSYLAAARGAVAERLAALPARERDALTRALTPVPPLFSTPLAPPPAASPTKTARTAAAPKSRGRRP